MGVRKLFWFLFFVAVTVFVVNSEHEHERHHENKKHENKHHEVKHHVAKNHETKHHEIKHHENSHREGKHRILNHHEGKHHNYKHHQDKHHQSKHHLEDMRQQMNHLKAMRHLKNQQQRNPHVFRQGRNWPGPPETAYLQHIFPGPSSAQPPPPNTDPQPPPTAAPQPPSQPPPSPPATPSPRLPKQSPIDVPNEPGAVNPSQADDLTWSPEYKEIPSSITAFNTGKVVQIRATYPGSPPQLTGGSLDFAYNLGYIEFHWGMTDDVGSEHTFRNIQYPMEIQAYYYREDLTEEEAKSANRGYVIVSYFPKLSDCDNPAFTHILKQNMDIKHSSETNIEEVFALSDLAPEFPNKYYLYTGSFTSEPNNVQFPRWILSTSDIGISTAQLEAFRQIAVGYPAMQDNFREVQPLNGRIIIYVQGLSDPNIP